MGGFTTRTLVKTESLTILLPAGFTGGQVYFPDDQYIRNKKLLGMELVYNVGQQVGIIQQYPDGKDLADFSLISQGWLTLESYSGVQFVRKKNLLTLSPTLFQGLGNIAPPVFVGQRTNWPKSYVEFPVIAALAKEKYIVFDIYFTELSKKTLQNQLGVGFQEKK